MLILEAMGPRDEAFGEVRRQAPPELVPERVVGPARDVVVVGALQVVPADFVRPHAAQREAALMARVDQLFVDRRRLRKDAEPPERIGPFERVHGAVRRASAGDPVEAVASGDEVGRDGVLG